MEREYQKDIQAAKEKLLKNYEKSIAENHAKIEAILSGDRGKKLLLL